MSFDIEAVRAAFPILRRQVDTLGGKKPLIYFDHGASTHAPQPVIDAVTDLMTNHYANIHRGNHTLSQEASDLFDASYETFASFMGASLDDNCIVLTSNTSGALDLAAHVMQQVPGKTLTTRMEHHSNDLVHRRRGDVVYADVDGEGRIRMDELQARLDTGDVKLVAVSGASNVTGHTPDLHKIARKAHDAGARILVDAAQLYAHRAIDVKADDHPEHLDFVAAAGHKSYAPFGSAFLYGPRDLFDAAPPHLPAGGTVDWVTDTTALHNKSPDRHMGGTPNIAGAVAFAAATRFLGAIGMERVADHEQELIRYGLKRFAELEQQGIELFGPRQARDKVGVFAFLVPGLRHETVSTILDNEWAIATRNGCFCAHPLLHRLLKLKDTSAYTEALSRGEDILLPGATRAAVGIYNTRAELDVLFDAIDTVARRAFKGTYPEPKASDPAAIEIS
jgi:cysteine desulfurase / selenocysteine lyase